MKTPIMLNVCFFALVALFLMLIANKMSAKYQHVSIVIVSMLANVCM